MKVLTVGTGRITEKMIEALRERNIEVFGCLGRDSERCRTFAERNGLRRYATDYDRALSTDLFDTVYLGIPNSLHHSYTLKALEKGKNVIVEKPFACNMKEAKEMIDKANNAELFIFDANTAVHSFAYRDLKKDLRKLGRIRTVSIDFYKYSSCYDAFLRGEMPPVFDPTFAGGALMDLGVYNVEFAVGLFGLPESCHYFPNMQEGIDTSGVAILKYGDFIVSMLNGKDADRSSSVKILGEKGCIVSAKDPSDFDSYRVILNDGTTYEKKYEGINRLSYELQDFKSLFDYRNYKKNNDYLTLTLMSMKVLDELRSSCGLRFKND